MYPDIEVGIEIERKRDQLIPLSKNNVFVIDGQQRFLSHTKFLNFSLF